jgi:hypothetical protein
MPNESRPLIAKLEHLLGICLLERRPARPTFSRSTMWWGAVVSRGEAMRRLTLLSVVSVPVPCAGGGGVSMVAKPDANSIR